MRFLFILLGGALFGAGLVISGMTDPSRVIGFLDIFGDWEPALAFVMGGAVFAFGLGQFFLRRSGKRICGVELPDTSSDPVSKRLLFGSAIFGIGWGIGGFCPGPAIANLSAIRLEAVIFVPLMLLGMYLAQIVFQIDR